MDVQRKEKPSWAVGFAAVGSVLMVVGLLLPWVETWLEDIYITGHDRETAGILSAVEVVEEVTGGARRAPSGGVFADLFFPVLAIVLTVLCCLVATVAAFGLRRKVLTNTLRVVGPLLVGATVLFAMVALVQLGGTISFGDSSPGSSSPRTAGTDVEEPDPARMISKVVALHGFWFWAIGAGLLALAAMLGPRVVHRLPDGTEVSHPAFAATGWPMGIPPGPGHPGAPAGPPGQGMAPAHGWPGWPGGPGVPPRMVLLATQPAAAVLGGISALLCFAGYTFLEWGPDTTFGDISSAVREHGLNDRPLAAAYFGWLGWIIMLGVLAVALALALGRRPLRLQPAAIRAVLIIGTIVAGLLHIGAMLDGEVLADLDLGSAAVTLGLLLAVIGSVLPLRPAAPMYFPPPGHHPGMR